LSILIKNSGDNTLNLVLRAPHLLNLYDSRPQV